MALSSATLQVNANVVTVAGGVCPGTNTQLVSKWPLEPFESVALPSAVKDVPTRTYVPFESEIDSGPAQEPEKVPAPCAAVSAIVLLPLTEHE